MQTITLCPTYISCDIKISKKTKKKGIYYSLEYYVGFIKKYKCGYFKEDELNKNIEQINKEKNTFNDIFIINKPDITQDIIRHFRYVEPFIDYDHQDVLIDPYILGVWLGDGNSSGPSLTNIDKPIINAWIEYGKKLGLYTTINNTIKREPKNINKDIDETTFVASYALSKPIKDKKKQKVYYEKNHDGKYKCLKCNVAIFDTYQEIWNHCQNYPNCNINNYNSRHNVFREYLKIYNLLDNKHIPIEYLQNSEEVRTKLLAGLIDTDGSFQGGIYEITQKNKLLSNNIVVLCKSLGFYTIIKEVQKGCNYKGEYKIGTYYRITISLNQFSKEIPVLLERKKWKYDRDIHINICNPFIDIDGNILSRSSSNIKWTEDMKIKLYSIVEKIKEMHPNKLINWDIVKHFDERFQNISSSSRSLDCMYNKTLLNKKDEYDNKKIDVTITEYDLIDIEWRKNYELIKERLDKNIPINYSNDVTLYNWLYKVTKTDNNLHLFQKELWEDLINKQRTIMNNIEMNDWKIKYNELYNYIKNNKKTPIEGTELGNWLKIQKKNYKNNRGILCYDTLRIELWKTLLNDFDEIITIPNNNKQTKVIFPDKTIKIFNSRNDVIREINIISKLSLTKAILKKRIESKKDFDGYYFEAI
jgi:hypothetical protein